jgi:hypothetical protein
MYRSLPEALAGLEKKEPPGSCLALVLARKSSCFVRKKDTLRLSAARTRRATMLEFHLLQDKGVLTLEPKAALTADDFKALAATVDPYLLEKDNLKGILISAAAFPGWDSFAALIEHMKFVRDHQRRIARVAVSTNNALLKIPPQIAARFAHPKFRVFSLAERDEALAWLEGGA